jgi:hypothetical protein
MVPAANAMLAPRASAVKPAVTFPGGHFSDRKGSGGMKTGEGLSLCEIADSTKRESAPPAQSVSQLLSDRAIKLVSIALPDGAGAATLSLSATSTGLCLCSA